MLVIIININVNNNNININNNNNIIYLLGKLVVNHKIMNVFFRPRQLHLASENGNHESRASRTLANGK